jgi:glycerol-3-phosphate dehydrogenase
MTRVSIVGVGAWGTAIANVAAVKATVVLLVHGEDTLMMLREARENAPYLPGVRFAGQRRADRRSRGGLAFG